MDYGLAAAGWEHAFFCEADPWRRDVLAARWPGVPIYNDVRAVGVEPAPGTAPDGRVAEPDGAGWLHSDAVLDLLCGGFPCQDVSVAGRRAGLAGDRSGLFFEFARIIDALRPRWVLVENVPGLLSSNGGRDFGAVLATLADLGYGLGWRVLDSRFFGVPQRRRRVFIVGAVIDDDPRAAAERAGEVLAVGSRCSGHPPTGTEAGPDVAPTLGASVGGGRGWDANPDRTALISPTISKAGPPGSRREDEASLVVAATLKSQRGKGGGGIGPEETLVAHTLRSNERNTSQGPRNYIGAPLTKGSATGEGVNAPGRRQEDDVNIVAFSHTQGIDAQPSSEAWPTLRSEGGGHADGVASSVRRLTPTECERLQGLPDGWTQLGDTPDSRRYSGLGDAVTATVAEWIGTRLRTRL